MIRKIKRTDCLDKYNTFPLRWYDELKEEEVFYAPKTFNSYILTLTSKSFKGHLSILGTELGILIQELGSDNLIFLGDNKLPWLHQPREYKPVKEAQQYLTANKIGKRFNGALQVSFLELPTFIKHLGWLIRCNAALPYFHFVDTGQNVLGNICQYGNIHLCTLKPETELPITSFVERSKFEFTDSSCTNTFSKSGAIIGRQILI
jgi:hypothetical protein